MTIDDLFYPIIKRRSTYIGNGDGYVSRYSNYRIEIQEDCGGRCVYCDIKHAEIGYEGMHLDHFRPQKYFPQLTDNPANLVLACPKCNRLKSYKWPASKKINACSHEGRTGFVDPFKESRREYFTVSTDGSLHSLQDPAKYVIKLMKLNRTARIQVRRNRIIQNEIRELSEKCCSLISELIESSKADRITADEALRTVAKYNSRLASLNKMLAV
ncbi:MAG: HNH endonuclease [Candidatus Aegiribacteria sp.]|nr:HNH endonuclease [Candidatus Aegiribacteria sp.]